MKYRIGEYSREYDPKHAFDTDWFLDQNLSNLFCIFANEVDCYDYGMKVLEEKQSEVEEYVKDVMAELYKRVLDDNG